MLKRYMHKLKPKNQWLYWVLALVMIPRIVLFFVNEQFNDDHITAVLLWDQTGELPEARDCWECFQPPLFYSIIKIMNTAYHAKTWVEYFYLVQFFNFFISLGLVWLILRFIENLLLPKWLSISSMLFWMLNPELISAGALAKNDLLLIFLSSITILLFYKYWKKDSLKLEIAIAIFLILLGITKGNGLVFSIAFPCIIFFKNIRDRDWKIPKIVRQLSIYAIVLTAIATVGRYYEKYEKYNNPFMTNVDPAYQLASWDEEGEMVFRKGVATVKSAYFDYPLMSLLETPYNKNGTENDQAHRQNLWTQFVGQFSHYVFERWPAEWSCINNDQYNFARVNFVLHTALIIFIFIPLFLVSKNPRNILKHSQFINVLLLAFFLAFVIKYTYDFRDFSFMKVLFMFPILLPIIELYSFAFAQVKQKKIIPTLLFLCTILYQVSFVYLILALVS